MNSCTNRSVLIGNNTTPQTICVYHAKDFRFGMYNYCVQLPYGGGCDSSPRFVIGFPNDPKMYQVTNLPASTNYWSATQESDAIFFSQWNSGAFVITDLTSHLFRSTASDGSTIFSYDYSTQYSLSGYDDNGGYAQVMGSGISANGEWAVFEMRGAGLVRVHLTDHQYTLYTTSVAQYGSGTDPHYNFAVSNDGRFIADYGGNIQTEIYDLSGCGDTESSVKSYWHNGQSVSNMCNSRNLNSLITQANGNGAAGTQLASNLYFTDDSGQLKLIAQPYTTASGVPARWVTIIAAGYTLPQRIDYLSLGDSFSSGEGDIADLGVHGSYYESGTDVTGNPTTGTAEELCHLSTRSYPFLVSISVGINSTYMKSIACSGAQRVDVQGSAESVITNKGYQGQEDSSQNARLLELPSAIRTQMQTDALNNFIPGRVQQIEFVKRYQPKAITLTLGGNDIGFGNIILSCVNHDRTYDPLLDCDWSSDAGIRKIGDLIEAQYNVLRDVYTDLKQASPETKIYVVGYPQFVSSTNSICETNVALSSGVRSMITQSVTYINNVIKAAAADAGVNYVDVENSLGDHVLCGSSLDKHVDGISSVVIANYLKSGFHPNDKGQSDIAQTIETGLQGQSLTNFTSCANNTIIFCPDNSSGATPTKPSYFTPTNTFDQVIAFASSVQDNANHFVTQVKLGAQEVVYLAPQIFQPSTVVHVEIHSTPVTLGDFTSASDGSLSGSITIPSDLGAGYHTIHVQGTSIGGQPIDYVQIIQVNGPNEGDIDNNGVADSTQKCVFITPSNTDADFDGVDDACDPYINPNPQIYRARLGDTSRTYNGAAENPNYIYIERNVYAQSVTGVTGDSDPDGDGWAIIGVSQGTPYTTTSVPDTGPIANVIVNGSGSSMIPYVYTRAGGYGCVEWKPSSMAQVQANQSRTLLRTAENTNKCRSQAPGDDVDGNGIPDNTQALYMARKGDSSIQHTKPDGTVFSEDPNKLYVFRNYYASETQIGISDYSPTGTAAGNGSQPIQAWNLLASTQVSQTIPAYDNLNMIQDSNGKPMPVILTKKLNGQCIPYEPATTDIIKMTTQYTRDIAKLTSLPQGTSCD